MKKQILIQPKTAIQVTVVLAALSALSLIFDHLALTDISHGGENLSLEWNILRFSAVILIAFITVSIFTLRLVCGDHWR
jgi:hypothetical protein